MKNALELIGDGTPRGAKRYRVARTYLAMLTRAGVGALFSPMESDGGGTFFVTRIDTEAREVDLMPAVPAPRR